MKTELFLYVLLSLLVLIAPVNLYASTVSNGVGNNGYDGSEAAAQCAEFIWDGSSDSFSAATDKVVSQNNVALPEVSEYFINNYKIITQNVLLNNGFFITPGAIVSILSSSSVNVRIVNGWSVEISEDREKEGRILKLDSQDNYNTSLLIGETSPQTAQGALQQELSSAGNFILSLDEFNLSFSSGKNTSGEPVISDVFIAGPDSFWLTLCRNELSIRSGINFN